LQKLYKRVLIPKKVLAELEIDADRPGSEALQKALGEGWLACTAVAPSDEIEQMQQLVDPGEAEAIALC
jgi:predicted nucleic acid-binding protein